MTAPILVAYATQYGSTRDVAEAIAATLRERGLGADVESARDVRTLEGRRAVVLGAPFYVGRWHQDARGFLARHREALAQRSVAIFALGPLSADEQEMRGASEQIDQELEKHPWLQPVAKEMFGGKYDPSRLSLFHKLLAALPASPLHGKPASDVRDWTAIREWASDVGQKLRAA